MKEIELKKAIGWAVLLGISFTPAALWYFLGPSGEFSDYDSITHSLGEILGLVGMTMFALTFILSTRIPFLEDVFGGLDKVYVSHGILGGTALLFILFHPILLVLKFIPQQIDKAAEYLLPSSHWSVNFGIISLLGLILLIYLTLFTKIKYNRWKFTHEFLGLAFIFAVLHIFLVRGSASRDLIFSGYYVYAAVVSAIGLFGFFYSLFLKARIFKSAVYIVSSVQKYQDYVSIGMVPEHKPIRYKSGQFIFVRFYNEKLTKESHPFSVTSASGANELSIVVKKLGDFTSRLEHLKVGDKVAVEGPYGRFDYRRYRYKDQVWLAGGIGVAPFLGMAKDLEIDRMVGKVDLFYSCSVESEFIGTDLFKAVSSRNRRFSFFPWNSGKQGYLRADVVEDVSGVSGKEFFLCGPNSFKTALIAGLKQKGVPISRIHEEVFDFR